MQDVSETLTFERGNNDKLPVTNADEHEHDFSSCAFAMHICTRKAKAMDNDDSTAAATHAAVNDRQLKSADCVECFSI